jgi:heme oxygenase
MLLDKKELQFYKYDGDMNASLDAVRKSINEISEQWTEDQKAHCLEETAASFKVC